jgi:perosamine synthetase
MDFHETVGFNFKFTDLQAVLGIEQMKKLRWRARRKKEMYEMYRQGLAGICEIQFLATNLDEVSPWFIDILVPDPLAVQKYLSAHDVGSRRFHPAIHSQPAFGWPGYFPNTEYAAQHGLWLPSSSFLADDDIRSVCGAIRAFFDGSGQA